MSLLRTFIAIELPQTIQETIARETSGLRQQTERGLIRWVAPQSMHLTLRFLGDTSAETVTRLKEQLANIARNYAPVDISVSGFGVFPNPKRVRVLWIGLQYPPTLTKLQSEIETLARQLSFEPEKRSFSPHLTIGRVSQRASTNEVQAYQSTLASVRIGQLGSFTANAIHLIRSDLRPSGAVYTTLFSAALEALQKEV